MTSNGTPVGFTMSGALTGARQTLGLALSGCAYGLIFGALTRQAGLSLVEGTLMSGLVFAGAAQFIAIGLWSSPVPLAAILTATLVTNLRFLPMAATLGRRFAGLERSRAYGSIFFLADESWALTMRAFAAGRADAAFLLGSGLVLFASWVSSTAAGHTAGAILGEPERWGLDVAFVAVFAALLRGFWKSGTDLVPWLAAGAVALAISYTLPGTWYILLGGLAGSLFGALRRDG